MGVTEVVICVDEETGKPGLYGRVLMAGLVDDGDEPLGLVELNPWGGAALWLDLTKKDDA